MNRDNELDGESPVDASSPDPRIAATIPLAPGGRLDRFGNLIKKRGAQQQLNLSNTVPEPKKKKKDKNRHKLSFIDKVEKDRELVSVVFVLS